MLLKQKSVALPLAFAILLLAGLGYYQYVRPAFQESSEQSLSRQMRPRKTLWQILRRSAPPPVEEEPEALDEILVNETGAGTWRVIEVRTSPSVLDARLEGDLPEPEDDGRLLFDFGARDTTGMRDVRTTNVMLGVGYQVSQRGALGLEASKEFRDEGDASLAGHSPETDETMSVRYRFSF